MQKRTLLFFFILLLSASALTAQDNDGDGFLDTVDLDDDNDGILDSNECEIPIANAGFESALNATTNWSVVGGSNFSLEVPNPGVTFNVAPEGGQFLRLEACDFFCGGLNGPSVATINAPLAIFEPGRYILSFEVGDAITDDQFENDGTSIIQVGYGNDAASFALADPAAELIIDGTTTGIGWNQYQFSFDIPVGSPILGEGVLIRITHQEVVAPPNNLYTAYYDNFQLKIDRDFDNIPDCFDIDSDGDGVNDVVEAGHVDGGGGVLDNLGINPDGTVIPAGTGYNGNTDDVTDSTKDGSLILDNDGDSYLDDVDLDDDNDGILDTNECDVPITNYSFEIGTPPGDPINGWSFTDLGSTGWGVEAPVLGASYYQIPNGNGHAYINDNGVITLNAAGAAFEPGDYIISFEVGDAIDFANPFANDGQSVFEIGYDNGTFQTIGTETVEAWQTPNGVWTDFSFNITVPAGSPAIGEGILVRITHTANIALNQQRGDYDQIRVLRDRDANGVPDCLQDDIDGDGCPDVTEAGHTDGGGGVIANSGINGDGTVTPIGSGYTGITQAVVSGSINLCTQDLDFDNDGVDDVVDLDDDNDGIRDIYECEIPFANHSFETDVLSPIDSWQTTNAAQVYGIEAVNGTNFITAPDGASFGFINGDGFVILDDIWGTYDREGTYILEFYIGDPIPFSTNFSNDSRTTVELGYSDGTTFNGIPGAIEIVESYETPNGAWSVFTVSGVVNNGDAAFGQGVSIRITHDDTTATNISQTTFDNFSLKLDSDGDGQPNCTDLDSDNAGGISCADVLEAGHTDAGGGLLGTTVDANGLVTGAPTGYTGPRWQMWDDSVNLACNPIDTDGDGVIDGDYYRYDAGNNLLNNIDLDNDNDGISDDDEDCDLINSGFLRQPYNFEVPANNFLLGGTNSPFSTEVNFWDFNNLIGTGEAYSVLVNAEDYPYPLPTPTTVDAPNYKVDGTLLPDLPDPDYQNDAYLALNDDVAIVQSGSRLILEEGVYMLTIAVGDALDIQNPYRNDGTSIIEIGYDTFANETFATYNSLGVGLTIDPEDTPNGTWTDFSFNFEIPAGSPAIGEFLSIRIEHQSNPALNQQAGNYDHIRIQRNSDGILTGDLIPDCQDLDSDDDGCFDVTEAGFDQDNDGVFDGGVTVNGVGEINGHSYVVDPTNLQNTRTPGDPVVVTTDPADATECEGSNASFSVVATKASGTLEYEWAESTDGGVNWTILTDVAPYSGTLTDIFTITGVTATQDGNQYRVRVSGDDYLCYEERIATLNVTPGPTLPTVVPVNANICEGDDAEFTISGDSNNTISYTINGGTNQTVVLDGAGNGTVTEVAVTVDTTIDITEVIDGTCTISLSPTVTSTITVSTPPTLTIDLVQCDTSLTTYFVEFTASSGTVTADVGTVVGNRVENIPDGTPVNITLTDGVCVVTPPTVAAPNCSCPTILPPINPTDAAVCEVNANVPISIELDPAGLGDTIDWYDVPTGGAPIGSGLSFTSTETTPGSYSYYAEAVETASGCMSNPRVEVIFTIHPLVIADILASPIDACDSYILNPLSPGNNYYTGPGGTGTMLSAGNTITTTQTIYIYAESGTTPNCTDESSFDVNITPTPSLTIDNRVCSADRTTYTVNFTPSSGTATVTNNIGILIGNSVTDIPAGTDVTLTITENSCSSATTVTALDCTCPTIDAPINPIDGANCEGTATANLSVDLPGTAGDVINWYDAPIAGNLVGTGLSFSPPNTAPGVYPYYAETLDTSTLCTSSTRTVVNLTIVAAPTADILPDANECGPYTLPPLLTGNNYYTGPGGTGTLLNPFDVITSSQTIYVYAQSGTSPNCTDESSFDIIITTLEIPQNPTNGFNCEGEPTATLSAGLPVSGGDTLNWYDSLTGGTLLATGTTFTPTETAVGTYTYYAENEDQISGCTSERIEVTLTIAAIPIPDTLPDQEVCEQFVLPPLAANNQYFTGPGGSGQQLLEGDSVTSPQTIYILAGNPENSNCTAESSFAVDILNEPSIMLPETATLCEASGESVQLGMDLGPQYRYDWTPNNDTNNDGIEEPIFNVTQAGTYSLQVFEIGSGTECGGSVTYTTEVVETLQALSIDVEVTADGFELNTGNRALAIVNNDNLLFDQFEYSLDNPDGPYQAQNYFENIPGGLHRIYVRGLSDCGSVLESAPFLIVNYPTVFTPNGDGTNETWNILGTENPNITGEVRIQIFDRHGKLMAQIDPLGEGWDGTYNTRPVPSTDYWFIVDYTNRLTNERVSFNGHFSLVR